MTSTPLIRSVTVSAPVEQAFTIFTERIGQWWPLATHSPAEQMAADLRFVDGRLVEASTAGDLSVWGSVTEWDPPHRLAFTWSPGGAPETSIAVDFEPGDDETRVVLTHVGWEAYGDRAEERREGYAGPFAWGWLLDLFALAVGEISTDEGSASVVSGAELYDVADLRAGYQALALALEPGTFGAPPAGEWGARQVAGHVITNAELMSGLVDAVRHGRPARLHGPDDHAASAIGRCDDMTFGEVATDVRRAGAELAARCSALVAAQLAAQVSTYIEHDGTAVIDGDMPLADLLGAQIHYHLPAHVGQVQDLVP